jgi:hypothetical protein
MDWAFVYLMFGLKIPIAALLWIVWWAIHQTVEPEAGTADEGGTRKPRHPHPSLPRRPRPRDAHGLAQPGPPPRMRVVAPRAVPAMRHQDR